MSGPIRCDLCQEVEALFLVTNMQNGDVTAACLADFARMGLESAKAVLPPEEVLSVLGLAPGPGSGAPVEGEGRPRRGRKSKAPAPEPPPQPETPEGLEAAPPSAPDEGDPGL